MQDTQAERAMLASVWLSQDADMVRQLEKQDFADPFHQWLHATLKKVLEAGEPLDMVFVLRWVKKPAWVATLKGDKSHLEAEVGEVLAGYGPKANIPYYLRVLRKERARRAFGQMADTIRKGLESMQEPADTLAYVKRCVEKLDSILEHERKS